MFVRNERFLTVVAATALLSFAGCGKPGQTTQPEGAAKPAAAAMQIGGADVVTLKRAATSNGTKPEFLSATILPGRGMNLFQITANIPGKGVISVLASPSVDDAAKKLTGTGDDQSCNASFGFGGAFLVPYPNRIRGKLSADGQTITTEWEGKPIT